MNIKIKKEFIEITKILVFILLLSMPFITIINITGVDIFLDSFKNPESYCYFKSSNEIKGIKNQDKSYLIIQNIVHPDFDIQKNDVILYCNLKGEIIYSQMIQINGVDYFKKYYIDEENAINNSILNCQIVGKIIKKVESNIWNYLSLSLWEISTDYLNIERVII
ncbi:MAG: hypothetical protein JSV62_04235 [Promethearchaeota archaeon]|nr:MAG: hypothetical protein JSV62_04235 [Candidatus Lokiarchaeota archaeon]